jgi:predicted translin family RNA/ssDNA-binding protein
MTGRDSADGLRIVQDTISTTQMRLNEANNRRDEDQVALRDICRELEKAQAIFHFHQVSIIKSLTEHTCECKNSSVAPIKRTARPFPNRLCCSNLCFAVGESFLVCSSWDLVLWSIAEKRYGR